MIRLLVLTAAALAAAPALAEELRIMTYNIHHGEGMDGRIDLERIANVIRAEAPDVICLQEVDQRVDRTGKIDMPLELSKKLNMNVAFGPNLDLEGGKYGTATLTRFDIDAHENTRLPGRATVEPRGCLKITIRVGKSRVDILNTHFGLQSTERKEQAARVLELISDQTTVLAGDLNETKDAPALRQLLTVFQDTFQVDRPGPKRTLIDGGETSRIDFVLASRDANVLSSRIISTELAREASDHLPYMAVIALPGDPKNPNSAHNTAEQDDRVQRITEEGRSSWLRRSTE